MEDLKWKKIGDDKTFSEPVILADKAGNGTATHYIPIKDLENFLEYEQ